MIINKDLLNLICCPNCTGDLKLISNSYLICLSCNSEYREKDGILVLISKELEEELRS